MTILALNRRAGFDYEILETYEAGIELKGFEVKAVKKGHMNLGGSFVFIKNNEVWLLNSAVSAYQPLNTPKDYDPTRSRKLLLHKNEIKKLIGSSAQKSLTIIPLKVYIKNNKVKVLIGLAKSKKQIDKRDKIKKREADREIERTLKHRKF